MKSEFKDPLTTQFLGDGLWEVTLVFGYLSELMDDIVVVPTGFITNFASVPYKTDPRPAVIHDYLYTRKDISRKLADQVFLEAMNVAQDVAPWRRKIRYWAVRLFGGSHKTKGE